MEQLKSNLELGKLMAVFTKGRAIFAITASTQLANIATSRQHAGPGNRRRRGGHL